MAESTPMRLAVLVVSMFAACKSSRSMEPAPAPVPPPAIARMADVDLEHGTLLTTEGGKPVISETFSLRKVGDHRVLSVRSVNLDGPAHPLIDGELETDAQGRPVRAAYSMTGIAFTGGRVTRAVRLGGAPLTLDVEGGGGFPPEHAVAPGPVAVFLEGPGMAALTPLCQVTGETLLPTIGRMSDTWRYDVEAYRGLPVGALHRIVVDHNTRDLELLCEGDRMIAGGLRTRDVWFVREGRDADLAALKAASPPAPHTWKHPVIAAEPWEYRGTDVFDRVVVRHDHRTRINRLTSFDRNTGAQLASRDIPTLEAGGWLNCEQMLRHGLACASARDQLLWVLAPDTLVTLLDVLPLLRTALPDAATPVDWGSLEVHGDVLTVPLAQGNTNQLDVDVAKRTARLVRPRPATEDVRDLRLDAWCSGKDIVEVGDTTWSIEFAEGLTTLRRTRGDTEQPPLPLPLVKPKLIACATGGSGVYAVSHQGADSVLARLDRRGRIVWTANLGAELGSLWMTGAVLIADTEDPARGVVAIDAASGKVLWTAAGPMPTR